MPTLKRSPSSSFWRGSLRGGLRGGWADPTTPLPAQALNRTPNQTDEPVCGEAKPHRGPEGLGHSFVEEPSRLPAPAPCTPQSEHRGTREGDPVPSAHGVSSSVCIVPAKAGQGLTPLPRRSAPLGRDRARTGGLSFPWRDICPLEGMSGAGSDDPPRRPGLPMMQRRRPEHLVSLDRFRERRDAPRGPAPLRTRRPHLCRGLSL